MKIKSFLYIIQAICSHKEGLGRITDIMRSFQVNKVDNYISTRNKNLGVNEKKKQVRN